MSQTWTNKDERQFEHIKDSEIDRGKSEQRAKEIAARTVNKQRRKCLRYANCRVLGSLEGTGFNACPARRWSRLN